MRCKVFGSYLILAGCSMQALGAQSSLGTSHPTTIEDLLVQEQVSQIAPSPDGRWIAVVVDRARTASEFYRSYSNDVHERGDVWLFAVNDTAGRNLTHGAARGAGYWSPVWSASGDRIAMLSTEGRDNVRLLVWRLSDNSLSRLSDRGVDLNADFGEGGGIPRRFQWLGDTAIAFVALPPGEAPITYGYLTQMQRAATTMWPMAERGELPTRRVFNVGPGAPPPPVPSAQLFVVGVSNSRLRSTGTFPVVGLEQHQIAMSPTGRAVAVITQTASYTPDRYPVTDSRGLGTWRLGVARLDSSEAIHWSSINVRKRSFDTRQIRPRWSSDERSVAAIGYSNEADSASGVAYLISASTGKAARLTPDSEDVSDLRWSPAGFLAYAGVRARGSFGMRMPSGADSLVVPTRRDWLLVRSDNARPTNITWTFANVSRDLLVSRVGAQVYLASAGALWAIDLNTAHARRLTDTSVFMAQSILWPDPTTERAGSIREVVASTHSRLRVDDPRLVSTFTRASAPDGVWCVDVSVGLNSGADRPVLMPTSDAIFRDFIPANRTAVVTADRWAGQQTVWISDIYRARVDTVLSLNREANALIGARRMSITYLGADGDSLGGTITLPVNYVAGRRYPLVVDVYGGTSAGSADTVAESPNLLAAHGYAVLTPSMPLSHAGEMSDPYIDMPKGVIGAVDKAIAIGVADPARLALFGHSYGGYSVMSILAYTHRFQTAISYAGFADLLSLYGTLSAPYRYTSQAADATLFPWYLTEGGGARMGAPPWSDMWRYWRNSPISYLDRIRTPLLLIHGDVDPNVPVGQAEEVFSGLYRLGGRVRFIQYSGEGHGINSPANMRDFWHEVFGWLDSFLLPKATLQGKDSHLGTS